MGVTEVGAVLVVCDAGPVIHLHELGCLDLLLDFPRVLIPEAVRVEIQNHRPLALSEVGERVTFVENPIPSGSCALVGRAFHLHNGEMMALMVAQTHPGSLLLTDDTAARMAAQALHTRAQGTLGILLRGMRRNLRSKSQVLDILRELRSRSSLHVSKSLLDEVLLTVEREAPG